MVKFNYAEYIHVPAFLWLYTRNLNIVISQLAFIETLVMIMYEQAEQSQAGVLGIE